MWPALLQRQFETMTSFIGINALIMLVSLCTVLCFMVCFVCHHYNRLFFLCAVSCMHGMQLCKVCCSSRLNLEAHAVRATVQITLQVLANPTADIQEGPKVGRAELKARGVRPYDEKVRLPCWLCIKLLPCSLAQHPQLIR